MDVKKHFVTPVWKWLLQLFLAVAGTVVYAGSFYGVFILDDYSAIVGNMDVRHIAPIKIEWRFITDLTFKITYAIGGLNTAYYHAGNLVIHILVSLLLYGVLRRSLLLHSDLQQCAAAAPWLAFFTALLWLVHPLQTQSVTYVCQRYESLMGLFFLLVLYCFIRGLNPGSRNKRVWYDSALVSCLLGMGTKEVMAMVPAVIFLYDYVFSGDSLSEILRSRWKVYFIMCCSVGILMMLILMAVSRHMAAGSAMFTSMSPWAYLLTQAEVIVHYLRLVFVPFPLCLDYAWLPVDRINNVILQFSFLVILGIIAALAVWKRMVLGFALGCFFIILAPTSSIMPLGDLAFEHRMYLPLAPVLAIIVVCAYILCLRLDRCISDTSKIARAAAIVMVLLIAVLLGVLTMKRNACYHSAEFIWRDVVVQRPHNIRALTNLGIELLKSGKIEESEKVSRRLLTLLNTGAIDEKSTYRIDPGVLVHYQSATHDRLGFALLCAGKTTEAIANFREAVRLRPRDGIVRHNLSLALFLAGESDKAVAELRSLLTEGVGAEKTHALLGYILAEQGDYRMAVIHYRTAVEMDPSFVSAKCELAWILATCPSDDVRNGKESLRLAKEVSALTLHASYHALDVLAAAYAENGMYEEAVITAGKASNIIENMKVNHLQAGSTSHIRLQASIVKEISARFELYKQGMAYRDRK